MTQDEFKGQKPGAKRPTTVALRDPGTRLVTNGMNDATNVADPGLSASPVAVLSLSPLGFGLAALLMLLGSRRALGHRSA